MTYKEWCKTTNCENKWYEDFLAESYNCMYDSQLGISTKFTFAKGEKISGIFSYGDRDGLVWNGLIGGNGKPNFASQEDAMEAYNSRLH